MTRGWWLVLGLVLVAARSAAGQAPTHNCTFCHNLHGGSFPQLTDFPTSEDLCLSCHSDAGPATVDRDGVQVPVPKNVAIHNGAKHPSPTTCRSCHDHEGESGGNLALVPRTLGTPNSGARTVVFTARSGPNSFADGDATYDGVCEVCHTLTDQHRNDGSAGKHNAAADCRACHQHRTGFQGRGGCTGCHNQPQDNGDNVPPGGRRAIVGEFARRSHHVQVTPADSIPDADCLTCHNLDQHQQGQVRLLNVDDASIVTLTGDPLASSAEAAKLAPFCLACHDANGAAGDVTPFSDNVTRPLIDSATWAVASHKTAPVLAGCYGNGTTGCHATGHGSLKKALLALPTVAPLSPDSVSEQEGFCYNCHDGSPASTDVQAEFQKGTNTATQIFHHPVNNTQQPAGRPVECTDCHNPHRARADAAAPTAPTASNRLLGVSRVAVTNGAAGTVPTYTFRPATDATTPREYELCFKCHSSYVTQPAGQTNLAVVLNPANPSYHPVEAAGKNTNVNANAFVNGWTAARTMYCTDCHTSDNAAVRGPHGSVNRYILKRPYTASSSSRTMSSGESCFDCHNFDTYANDNASNTVKGYSRFNPPTFDRGHTFHVDDRNRPCYACHATHGSATRPHLIVTGRNPGLNNYTETANGGSCSPTCHGQENYTINYAR